MEFINHNSFTEKEKIDSFLFLQMYISTHDKYFIGRLSGNEQNICQHIIHNINISEGLINNMLFGAGIQFTSKDDIINYVNLLNTATLNCDVLGVWDGNMYSQVKLYYEYLYKIKSNVNKICAHALEPFYYMNNSEYNFSSIFKNKKILIITSHNETVKTQLYKKCHDKPIFHKTSQFYVYKPPQQNGGSHDTNSWSFHFEKMKQDINTIKKDFNFDIALISCGGFGMLISNYIYTDLNSSVMYIGGALQLYFGIMGSRWKNSSNIITNHNWTNVLDCDKPKNTKLCENSCYW